MEQRNKKRLSNKSPEQDNNLYMYRLFFEKANDGFLILHKGCFTDCNLKAAELLGRSREEIIGAMPWDISPAKQPDGQNSKTKALKVIEDTYSGGSVVFEWVHTRSDGAPVDLEVSLNQVKTEQAQIIFVTWRDISERKRAEAALRQSQERLIDAQHIAGMGDFTWDVESGEVTWSEALHDLLKYDKSEKIDYTKINQEIHHPDDRERVNQWLNDCITSGSETLTPNEYRLKRKDGEIIYVRTRGILKRTEGKSPIIFGTVQDITERKHAERLLRESEELHRITLSQISDAVFITDDKGEFTYICANVAYIFGFSLEEVKAMGNIARLIGDDFEIPSELAENEEIKNLEHTVRDKNGKEHNLLINLKRVFIKGGTILYSMRDITERTQAEARLAKSEKKYRTLFEQSKDVIFFSTPGGKFREINSAGVELFGYSSNEELMEIDISRDLYVEPKDRHNLLSILNKQGYAKDYEVDLRKKDGSSITVQITAQTELDDDGSLMGYRGIIRDISHQKRLQEQLLQAQKMEAMGTLAGGIAHDFNNILAALMGYVELLRLDLPQDSISRNNLEEVYAAALRAKELVYQILTFSRKNEPKFKEIQPSSVIKEAVRFLRASLPATITIKTEIEDSSDTVLADATQMHQVIMNLGTNALQAMGKGGELKIALTQTIIDKHGLSTGSQLPEGNYFKLTVSDTGHGIDPETLEQIFDPFFTTKPAGEGTGMGLSVVHGIIKNHHGHISVYSQPGQGTTFTVYLPRQEKKSQQQKAKEEVPAKGNERILLVDDEEAIVSVGKRLLENLGYYVEATTKPVQALQLLKQNPQKFDLVITDLTMPQLSGIELVVAIRDDFKDIPIVLMTGFRDMMSEEMSKKLNIKGYLSKPFVTLELSKIVRSVLDDVKVVDL